MGVLIVSAIAAIAGYLVVILAGKLLDHTHSDLSLPFLFVSLGTVVLLRECIWQIAGGMVTGIVVYILRDVLRIRKTTARKT